MFLEDENANITKNTQDNIGLMAQAWLSLKTVWAGLKVFFANIFQLVALDFKTNMERMASIISVVSPKIAGAMQTMADKAGEWIEELEKGKKKNIEIVESLEQNWKKAPAILRKDMNRLVATFKAIPEGIRAQIESAFPGAIAAYEELINKMKVFIETGSVGLEVPITFRTPPDLQKEIADILGPDPLAGFGAELPVPTMGPLETDETIQTRIDLMNKAAFEAAALGQKIQDALTPDTAKIAAAWKGVALTYANVFSQLSGLYKKGSAEQKAFAIASIILDTAIGIMKSFELPFPLNWAQAAAVAVLGIAQLSAVGGSGGSSGGVNSGASATGTDFTDQTQLASSASSSQVIGTPEQDIEPGGVELRAVVEGDDLAFVLTRAAGRGAGDGVNTLALQGA